MYSNAGNLWAMYIIVIIISYVGLWFLSDYMQKYYQRINSRIRTGIVFFLATIIGGITVFIGTGLIDPNNLNNNDKLWLSVLYLFVFLFPIFVIIWIGGYISFINIKSD